LHERIVNFFSVAPLAPSASLALPRL
jgi:hypothetical protein